MNLWEYWNQNEVEEIVDIYLEILESNKDNEF